MNMKWLARLAFGVALISGAMVSWAQAITAEEKESVLATVTKTINRDAFVPGIDFKKWEEFLASNRDAINKAEDHASFVSAVNRALRSFSASHILLHSPAAAKARVERSNVGIGIQALMQPDGVRVINVFPSSPAADAGLRPDDLITHANGEKVEAITQLGRPEGTQLKLTVVRQGSEPLTLEVTTRKYRTVIPESLKWVSDQVAVLRIPTFDLSYNPRNVDQLLTEAGKAELLIIDLRGNGGGSVANLMHFAAAIVTPERSLGTFIHRRMVERYETETKGDPTDLKAVAAWSESQLHPFRPKVPVFAGKVAVLVDRGTASASEIAAASMSEEMGAPLIGQPTAGAVLASTMVEMPLGFRLQIPIMDYVSPKGLRIEGKGLTPGISARNQRYGEPDEGIEKALAWWKGTIGLR